MRIVGIYSFNAGEAFIRKHFPHFLAELESVIQTIDAESCRTKVSAEKTMHGKTLYSPIALNDAFKSFLYPLGWKNVRERCDYSQNYYVEGYQRRDTRGAFRDMDFVKDGLGIEVQFGKYAFMVYNVCAKMTIFRNLGHIQAGIEVVPVKELSEQMSSGVSYFEQFTWDLDQRGVSDIDIPVMVIGIAP